jgi:DNA (cytosine-5)-methyltransferase 1
MNHLSLFSGIGGFDLAAEAAGWNNVAHCEINQFCRQILAYYWPNAISHDDIKKTDFTPYWGTVDVISGGFPCQPYSVAGQRKGTEDDRHLWPEMLRAIREVQPAWVVGENVSGILSWNRGLVFEQVQADLEVEGYEVQPFVLPACGLNAPHKRERVWFVAHAYKFRRQERRQKAGREQANQTKKWKNLLSKTERCGSVGISTHANQQHGNLSGFCTGKVPQQQKAGIRSYSNADSTGRQECYATGKPEGQRFSAGFSGRQWQNWPTQPPVCGGNDGVSAELDGITFSKWRNESLKGYGNAIVPQVAYQIFQAINQYELTQLFNQKPND